MKKVLSTAVVLGTLYGASVSAAPVTSPIYMPEAGKILSTLNVGYTIRKGDKQVKNFSDEFNASGKSTDKLYDAINVGAEGQFGLAQGLSLNYGWNFDFARKSFDADSSAAFTNYYMGVTGRVVCADANKLDLFLNVGQSEDEILGRVSRPYAEFGVRYGLDLDFYNLGLSVKGKYVADSEFAGFKNREADGGFDVAFALENEFIFTEDLTVGLDLTYARNDDFGVVGSYNVFGVGVDANYAVTENNFVGLYFNAEMNDAETEAKYTGTKFKVEPTTYKFGLKMTSQF